jgi:hypothetical protein
MKYTSILDVAIQGKARLVGQGKSPLLLSLFLPLQFPCPQNESGMGGKKGPKWKFAGRKVSVRDLKGMSLLGVGTTRHLKVPAPPSMHLLPTFSLPSSQCFPFVTGYGIP